MPVGCMKSGEHPVERFEVQRFNVGVFVDIVTVIPVNEIIFKG